MKPVGFQGRALTEYSEALEWYEQQEPGLAERLGQDVGAVVELISHHPEMNPVVHRDIRRALLRRFPYVLYYRVLPRRVTVVAFLHASRNPARWRSR